VQNAIAELGGDVPMVWTYIPTPLARETIANLPRKLLIYDCVDALTENPKGVFASYAESEKMVSREADIVFVTSRTLYERQHTLNPHTYYVPHGVLYEKFADVHPPLPRAFENIPAPRLLFFGGIDERLDLQLLERLAARQPAWHIILMGVVRSDISALEKFSNVHVLAPQPHDVLPAYLHHADVFLLPYAYIPFSHYMNPVKLHECLAVGKPIVATALPVFAEYREVLYVAETADAYEKFAHAALAEKNDAAKTEQRRARARANTWAKRFAEIQEIVENRISNPQPPISIL
jgi:glycosyltransferase involved in cell wall biosynthesis